MLLFEPLPLKAPENQMPDDIFRRNQTEILDLKILELKITRFEQMLETLEGLYYPYVMRCAIWHNLHNLKNVKNIHRGVTFSKVAGKSSTPPWVFFMFFKLYK